MHLSDWKSFVIFQTWTQSRQLIWWKVKAVVRKGAIFSLEISVLSSSIQDSNSGHSSTALQTSSVCIMVTVTAQLCNSNLNRPLLDSAGQNNIRVECSQNVLSVVLLWMKVGLNMKCLIHGMIVMGHNGLPRSQWCLTRFLHAGTVCCQLETTQPLNHRRGQRQIGRASCRERV